VPRRLSILGSTGSIGVNALEVVDNLAPMFDVVGLSTYHQGDLIVEQALKYDPEAIAVVDETAAEQVRQRLDGTPVEVLVGREGLLRLSARSDVDLLLNGLVGSAGMEPTLLALEAGVDVALSNKESLVMAGSLIQEAKERTGAQVFPVDSEHSALWQCLQGESIEDVKRIILTGSGGPFRQRDRKTFPQITPEEALQHPNWKMGRKITIDSATMMNKGLEVIEAHWLFGLDPDAIDIVIHPQSIIHSLVEFKDGSVKAQLGVPDMKIPIQYALTHPRHLKANWKRLDLIEVGSMGFDSPDLERFPCIELAYQALRRGGTQPAVLNVANEQAVYRFLAREISFIHIPRIIEAACAAHDWRADPSLRDLQQLEQWTTRFVKAYKIG